MIIYSELTDEEKSAIRSLQKLAKNWPKTLWLFSGAGSLYVMRTGEDGYGVHAKSGSVDFGVHSRMHLWNTK